MIRIPFFKTNVCIIFLKSVKNFGLQKYEKETVRHLMQKKMPEMNSFFL
ncbi:hypothetical protein AQPE_2941 [Aquipluma nitroreducens]|uniref:Uncharacterized protein n=1 Tax=Aquipluma nitroreducens TaxID=2010828 RepID=A0A5K7SB84_9BACT|nr:hypothetical protein AQPE_2941 [Aquipluma nitroreducens]